MQRIVVWALRRAVPKGQGARGRLVWVDADGVAWDLGLYMRAELAGLAWATRVADRATRERSERVRLAALRQAAARLEAGARRLPAAPEKG